MRLRRELPLRVAPPVDPLGGGGTLDMTVVERELIRDAQRSLAAEPLTLT